MLKRERLLTITRLVDQQGFASVNEISEALGVSAMTVRRDLEELDADHAVMRIHGGAQRVAQSEELSRGQKQKVNVPAKREVASLAAKTVKPGDSIYLGPGTTNELLADFLNVPDVRIITNSLAVFERLLPRAEQFSLQLIGGRYRERSAAFVGSLANAVLETIGTDKAFISVNGIDGNTVTNANPEEGQTQRIALNNAAQKYIVADYTKLNRRDFYTFYELNRIDALFTNTTLSDSDRATYEQFTTIITSEVEL